MLEFNFFILKTKPNLILLLYSDMCIHFLYTLLSQQHENQINLRKRRSCLTEGSRFLLNL